METGTFLSFSEAKRPAGYNLMSGIKKTAKCSNKKSYQCKYCGATFGTYGGRYYHMALHTGQYKYTCDMCDKGFMKTDAFLKHKLVHRKQIQKNIAI